MVDPTSGVALVQGGYSALGALGDAWLLQLPSNAAGGSDPVWTHASPSGSSIAPRYGAAVEFLPDFGVVLMFGGMSTSTSPAATPVRYFDDIVLLSYPALEWTTLTPPSASGVDNTPGPFGRAHASWAKTSSNAVANPAGDLTYKLLLYGGRGSSVANGIGGAYDEDQADLWMYTLSRNSSAMAGSSMEFYGSWERAEPTLCTDPICADTSTLATRWTDVGAAITNLQQTLSPGKFTPSTLVTLLDDLRTASSTIGSTASAQLASWISAGPHTNAPCTAGCRREVFDSSSGALHPGKIEGQGVVIYGDKAFYFGGYSCVAQGSTIFGGAACFTNDIWILTISTGVWEQMSAPTDGSDPNWPSPRAFHSQVALGNRMFVFGGGLRPEFALTNFYSSVWVFDLDSLTWQTPYVSGVTPQMGWGGSMVVYDGNAFLVGGCMDEEWSSSVYQLRVDQSVYPENIFLSGPGVDSGANITTGVSTWFLLTARAYTPPSVTPPPNSPPKVPGAGQIVPGTWGNRLTWATGLKFQVQLINEDRGLTRASVVEVGGGVYNASFTLERGHLFNLYVMLGTNPSLARNDVIGTPLKFYNSPASPAPLFLTYDAKPTIEGEDAFLLVHLRDAQGNPRLQGGDIEGAISAATGGLANTAANNKVTMLLIPGATYPSPASVPDYLQDIGAGGPSVPNALDRIVDLGDGSYRLEYSMPRIIGGSEGESTFQLFVYFNGLLFGSAAAERAAGGASAALSPSDAAAYPMPITLQTFKQHSLDSRLVQAGYVLTSVCLGVVAVYMIVLTIYREERVVKASSYFFLMTLCAGVLLCFVAAFTLSVTNDHSCRAYPLILGFGYDLLIGSLFVKSQRIMSIFTTKKLQVMNLSNLRTGFPVLILLAMELVFSIAWLVADPLHRVSEPYVNNPIQSYTHCDSRHKNIWVAVTFLQKTLLAVYGIYLATKTRNVPKAYNESKLMAFSLYNIAFTVLICFLLLYITQSNDDVNVPYIVQVLTILWCCMWTCSLLIVPRIYYIINPPGADFYMATKSRAGVSGTGTSSMGGTLSRKNTFDGRKNTVTERKNTVTDRKNTVTDRKGTVTDRERTQTLTRKPTMSGGIGGAGAPVRKNTAAGGAPETEMTAPASGSSVRPLSTSTAVRPASASMARPMSASIAPAAGAGAGAGAGAAARPASTSVANPRNLPPLPAPRGASGSTATRPAAASVARALPPPGSPSSPTPASPSAAPASPLASSVAAPPSADEHAKLTKGRNRGSSEDFTEGEFTLNPALAAMGSAGGAAAVASKPPPPPPAPASPRAEGEPEVAPPAPSSPFALRAQPHRPSVDLTGADMSAFRPSAPPAEGPPASPSVIPASGVGAAHPSSMDSSSSESDSETEREEVRKVVARHSIIATGKPPPPPPPPAAAAASSASASAAPAPAAVSPALAAVVASGFVPPPPPPGSDDEDDEESGSEEEDAAPGAAAAAARPAPPSFPAFNANAQASSAAPAPPPPRPAMPLGGMPPPPPPPGDPDDDASGSEED